MKIEIIFLGTSNKKKVCYKRRNANKKNLKTTSRIELKTISDRKLINVRISPAAEFRQESCSWLKTDLLLILIFFTIIIISTVTCKQTFFGGNLFGQYLISKRYRLYNVVFRLFLIFLLKMDSDIYVIAAIAKRK